MEQAKTEGSARRWTAEKRHHFLEQLAATANIRRSVRLVGMSLQGLYALRRRDEGFRAQMALALEAGYERIELALIAAAVAEGASVDEGEFGPVVEPKLNPDLAFRLLEQRRRALAGNTGGGAVKRMSEAEIEAELVRKLKPVMLREEAGEAAPPRAPRRRGR